MLMLLSLAHQNLDRECVTGYTSTIAFNLRFSGICGSIADKPGALWQPCNSSRWKVAEGTELDTPRYSSLRLRVYGRVNRRFG
jgi:hypothetical protein